MRKFLIVIFMMILLGISSNVDAQSLYFRTTEFSIKYKIDNNRWTDWSDWEKSNMRVKIDLDDDEIIIYSKDIQVYRVINHEKNYTDDSGGRQMKFYVIDQDNDRGYIRFRAERNGNNQIYVDFNDVMWVYNVKRIE